jgi:Domain of unknown function (DUF4145)
MPEANVVNVRENLRKCNHCDAVREMTLCTSYQDSWYYEDADLRGYTTWRLYQCPACEKPTLQEESFLEGDPEADKKELYPGERPSLKGLPYKVKEEYSEALKLQNVSLNACANGIRRTLEGVCKEENAVGTDLFEKIKDLADKQGRIPKQLADMAHLIRMLGNLGSHSDEDEDEVTSKDLTTMIEFVEALLEYIYIAPAKIKLVQDRLAKKKASHAKSNNKAGTA